MRKIWGWGAALAAMSAHAGLADEVLLKEIPCAEQVFRALGQWEPAETWSKGKGSEPGSQVVRAKTAKKGVELKVTITRDREVRLARDTKTETTEIRIQPTDCRAEVGVQAKNLKLPKNSFTDQDLDRFLANGRKNNRLQFIYIWSPHMNLSVSGLKEAEKVARDMKAELLVLLDPKADLDAAKAVAKRHGIKQRTALDRALSSRLFALDQRLHYPVYFVAHAGAVVGSPRWGQDFAAEMKTWVTRGLASQKKNGGAQ